MEMVDVDGLPISYERAGSGPALVLAHGFVGDGRSTWSAQLDDLSDEFTVVAWDAPGAGRSAPPPSSFRIADYAGCLAGFVRALQLDRPHVVGLSFGGIVALELFRRRTVRPADSGARWRLRRLGRLATGRRSSPNGCASACREQTCRQTSSPRRCCRRCSPSRRRPRPCRLRRQRAGVQPGRVPCHDVVVGRGGPTRRPRHRDRAHPAPLRRPGRARSAGRRTRPPRRDSRNRVDHSARCRPCQSRRGARTVQPRTPQFPKGMR